MIEIKFHAYLSLKHPKTRNTITFPSLAVLFQKSRGGNRQKQLIEEGSNFHIYKTVLKKLCMWVGNWIRHTVDNKAIEIIVPCICLNENSTPEKKLQSCIFVKVTQLTFMWYLLSASHCSKVLNTFQSTCITCVQYGRASSL